MSQSESTMGQFAFGENWTSFARLIGEERIEQAELGLKRLFPNGEIAGTRFLDIGCGSGLSSLAAARLGAAEIDAIDVDSDLVTATRATLEKHAPDFPWTVRVGSVFDLSASESGQYGIVYSWGVLHHTGDMWRALNIAAAMVKPGGFLAIALYHQTPLCGFWKREKKFYMGAPRFIQAGIRALYMSAWHGNELRHGRNPVSRMRQYHSRRGMDWSHDVHDWLGGYPYESASADEVRQRLAERGFAIAREFVLPKSSGIWGSGCDEYVAVRKANG